MWNAAAVAQNYPSRPVRFLVPNPPGGGTDLAARITAQKVSDKWGANIVVDNRPGAGGIIAGELVARAAPDGHTLLLAHFALAITVNIARVPFDPVRDFAPVILLATTQNVLAVNPSVPAKSVKLEKVRWDPDVRCPGQLEPGIRDVLWKAIMQWDRVGAGWGPEEGVMRGRAATRFGWPPELAARMKAPTLVMDRASKEWLAHGRLEGRRRGELRADPDGGLGIRRAAQARTA